MEPKLVTVCTYEHPAQAELAKLALAAEGLTAFVTDAEFVASMFLGLKLQVPESDVPAAMALLAANPSLANPSADRPADDGVPRCLSCGATMPAEATACGACGWSYLDGATPEDVPA